MKRKKLLTLVLASSLALGSVLSVYADSEDGAVSSSSAAEETIEEGSESSSSESETETGSSEEAQSGQDTTDTDSTADSGSESGWSDTTSNSDTGSDNSGYTESTDTFNVDYSGTETPDDSAIEDAANQAANESQAAQETVGVPGVAAPDLSWVDPSGIKTSTTSTAVVESEETGENTLKEAARSEYQKIDASYLIANAEVVNIYEDRSDAARVVGTIPNGGVMHLLKIRAGWFYIESQNVRGYVHVSDVVYGPTADDQVETMDLTQVSKASETVALEENAAADDYEYTVYQFGTPDGEDIIGYARMHLDVDYTAVSEETVEAAQAEAAEAENSDQTANAANSDAAQNGDSADAASAVQATDTTQAVNGETGVAVTAAVTGETVETAETVSAAEEAVDQANADNATSEISETDSDSDKKLEWEDEVDNTTFIDRVYSFYQIGKSEEEADYASYGELIENLSDAQAGDLLFLDNGEMALYADEDSVILSNINETGTQEICQKSIHDVTIVSIRRPDYDKSDSEEETEGLTGDTVEEQVWNYLTKKIGMSEVAAAGAMGNMKAECGFQTGNLENWVNALMNCSDEQFTAAVDTGVYTLGQFLDDKYTYPTSGNGSQWGYGLIGFTSRSAKAVLWANTVSVGKSLSDLEGQLDAMAQIYGGKLFWVSSASVEQAASDWFYYIEMGNPMGTYNGYGYDYTIPSRQAYALTYYNAFHS